MTSFESNSFQVSAEGKHLLDFLANPANLEGILPTDRIENWRLIDQGCAFKIKGLADISIVLGARAEDAIQYRSSSDKPFDFTLEVRATTGQPTMLQAFFHADVNSFMGMMLKSPLTNFLNTLGEGLKRRFDGD
jgi:hypothetical protein